jgi:hypothetical protein
MVGERIFFDSERLGEKGDFCHFAKNKNKNLHRLLLASMAKNEKGEKGENTFLRKTTK